MTKTNERTRFGCQWRFWIRSFHAVWGRCARSLRQPTNKNKGKQEEEQNGRLGGEMELQSLLAAVRIFCSQRVKVTFITSSRPGFTSQRRRSTRDGPAPS